jgi:hypothetical protein
VIACVCWRVAISALCIALASQVLAFCPFSADCRKKHPKSCVCWRVALSALAPHDCRKSNPSLALRLTFVGVLLFPFFMSHGSLEALQVLASSCISYSFLSFF